MVGYGLIQIPSIWCCHNKWCITYERNTFNNTPTDCCNNTFAEHKGTEAQARLHDEQEEDGHARRWEEYIDLVQVPVWPDVDIISSIFGHLQQWKSPNSKKMVKVGLIFCQILENCQRIAIIRRREFWNYKSKVPISCIKMFKYCYRTYLDQAKIAFWL